MKKFLLILLVGLFWVIGESGYASSWEDWEESSSAEFSDADELQSTDELLSEDQSDDWGLDFFSETSGRIYTDPEFLDGDLLKLSVIAEDVESPVVGVAFHLNYDKENVTFLRYDPGEFLERGGDPFYLVKDDKENSKIIFGETLRRDDSFPVGGEKITDFYFQILNWDKFAFTFDRAVVSTIDSTRQDLDKVNFEDLLLDKNSDDRLSGSFDENDDFSVNLGAKNFNFQNNNMVLILIVTAICVAVFLIYFIKKQEKKRHTQYVNFK